MERWKVFFFLSFLLLPSVVWGHASIAVDLTIMEALPDDPNKPSYQRLGGLDRTQEPVTIGIPLPGDTDTPKFEVTSFVLLTTKGATKELFGQFRVLQRWPSGHIKWLLVDTLADVKAGQSLKDIRLFTGGSRKIPALATDQADRIVVDTGAAKYVINKKKFNLFDEVTIDGVTLVTAGKSPGIVLRGEDDKLYTSSNDTNVKVVLEENGPVRSAIVAKGSHVSDDGKRNLDFTVRMHFYRGKKRVRVLYSLRNASKQQVANVSFKSVELVVQTTLAPTNFVLRNHTDETTGTVTEKSVVRVFQGENNLKNVRDADFTKQVWPTNIEGYTITQDGKELQKGTREQPIALFYGQLSEKDQKSVVVGTRFAAGWWPQGLTLQGDGSVRIGVFPPGNDKLYTVPYRSHTTREHVFHFDKGVSKAHDVFYKFQYPLVARLEDSDKYNRRLNLWEKISSFIQEWDYYNRNKWPYDDRPDATLNRRPDLIFPRFINWSLPGYLHNYDLAKIALHNYIRQDNFLQKQEVLSGGYYLQAEQRFTYYADRAIPHSDDFNGAKALDEVPILRGDNGQPKTLKQLPNGDKIASQNMYFHGNYRHAYGLSAWYFTTGDERIKEAYQAWGEHMQTQQSWNEGARSLAWNIFNWVDLFVFTGQAIYQKLAWDAIQKELLEPVLKPGTSGGIDWQRGFFVARQQAKAEKRELSTVVMGAILLNAIGYFLESAATEHAQQDKARSLLEGLSRFVAQERWTSYGDKPGDYGYPPTLAVDTAQTQDLRKSQDWAGGIQDTYLSFFFGYLLSGEKLFLQRGELMLKASAYNPGQTYWFQDLPSRQTMQQLLENTGTYTVWRPLPIRSQPDPDNPGTYKIYWTVPDNTLAYWIKYSTKSIVPWLHYDPKTQTFQHDPAKHTPFFAAQDISDEPKPSAAGKPQCHVVSGLDAKTTYHFAARFLSVDSTPPPEPPASCGGDTPAETTDKPDAGTPDTPSPTEPQTGTDNTPPTGCNCTTGGYISSGWFLLLCLLGLGMVRRRRRPMLKQSG